MQTIYADYAATSMNKPQEVYDAVVNAMKTAGNPGRGSAGASLTAGRLLYEAREKVAQFFDASSPDCVAFTSGDTESLNLALKGLLGPNDHVITTQAEHNSVLRPLYQLEDDGMDLSIVAPTFEDVTAAVNARTKAVVMTHGSNVTGEVYDITAIGKYCMEHGILLIVDAAQTAGIIPISMKKMGISVLCFAGHKSLLGPEGVGGICVCPGISFRHVKTGGSGIHSFARSNPDVMPEIVEAGTVNLPGIAGMMAGIAWIEAQGIQMLSKKEVELAYHFYEKVRQIPGVHCYGEFSDLSKHTPTVSLNIGDFDAAAVSEELWERFQIQTRPGAHCAPLIHEHYHTEEQGMVRFSFGVGTTREEIMRCLQAMQLLAEEAMESV